ncbi:MAG: glycosyltransferase family 9 protein, partial [Candidatus Cloacimonadota bacterium]|nr:glycosyltransferase family 9 protein [Candidatus Cloacimonadota bacterium]
MKVLILNLTRMGDIIQTSSLINGLKKKHANISIDCITMSSFKSILENFPNINNIYTLDDTVLVEKKDNILTGFLEIKNKIQKLNQQKYDIILNLVISEQSSYLTYLLKSFDKRGMLFNKEREQKIKSDWTAYHLANEHHLGDHSLNLVDIFNGIGDVKPDFNNFFLTSSENARDFAEKFWSENSLTDKKVIGFHIGASNSNKSWEVDKFKKVILNLIGEYKVILFGGYKEKGFEKYFEGIDSKNFINLIGQSNLDKLVALMKKIDLLVSNDTGPMHIAASQKTSIIDLSLGPVSHWETAPYQADNIVMQANIECHPCKFNYACSHLSCHNYISVESVTNVIYYKLENIKLQLDKKIKYWITKSDTFGFHHSVPFEKREISKKEMIFEFKRAVWILTLQDKLGSSKYQFSQYLKYLKTYYKFTFFNFSIELNSLKKCSAYLSDYLSTVQEILKLNLSDKQDVRELSKLWEQSKEQLLQATSIANKTDFVTDYFSFASFKNSGIESGEIMSLAKKNYEIYCLLQDQLTILSNQLKMKN